MTISFHCNLSPLCVNSVLIFKPGSSSLCCHNLQYCLNFLFSTLTKFSWVIPSFLWEIFIANPQGQHFTSKFFFIALLPVFFYSCSPAPLLCKSILRFLDIVSNLCKYSKNSYSWFCVFFSIVFCLCLYFAKLSSRLKYSNHKTRILSGIILVLVVTFSNSFT